MANAMYGLAALARRFAVDRPFVGNEVLLHMHLTEETLTLGETMAAGGARLLYLNSARTALRSDADTRIASHHGRMQHDLADLDQPKGTNPLPLFVVEGNGRVFNAIHAAGQIGEGLARVRGISEHTSGGGRQIDEFEARGGEVRVPIVAVYRNHLKTLLETGLGTSQSTTAALLRCLGVPLAGRRVTLVGYGHVGRGLARFLSVLGARVTVVDVRAEAALQATLAGYETRALGDALSMADMVITATGQPSVITVSMLEHMRDGVILGNVSNCATEIDTTGCRHTGRAGLLLDIWLTPSGRPFVLLVGGIQLNHGIENGNPAELMDLSFSLHALTLEWLAKTPPEPAVHPVPAAIAERAAALCLDRRA